MEDMFLIKILECLLESLLIKIFHLFRFLYWKRKDINKKKELILLQDKIKGIYVGSKKEEKELNLKEETLSKYNILMKAIKEKRKVKILYYSFNRKIVELFILLKCFI